MFIAVQPEKWMTHWISKAGTLVLGFSAAIADIDSVDVPLPQSLREEALADLHSVNGYAFSPDVRTVFLTLRVDARDARGRARAHIFVRRFGPEGWGAPEAVSFAGAYTDYQPVLSPDGGHLFFTSTRPVVEGGGEARQNIWVVSHRDGILGTPRLVHELVADGWDGHAVQVRDGSIYFASDRPGGKGDVDIWRAEATADGFAEPINVAEINSEVSDQDLYVDPAERYMIFTRYDAATGETDLFASTRTDGVWRRPIALSALNRPGWELSPALTPDGRWLIFQHEGRPQVRDWAAVRAMIESGS